MAHFNFSVYYSIESGLNVLPGNINFHGISLSAVNTGAPKPAATVTPKSSLESFRKSPSVDQLT